MSAQARSTARDRVLGLLGAIAVGVLLSVQSRINGTLGARLQDGAAAALISFGSGLVVLLIGTAFLPAARRGLRRVGTAVRGGGLRWWHLLGGISGGYLVFSQSLTAATLGVALFTVAVVAGQVSSGMVVDRLGLGPAGPQRVTPPRMIGGVLAVIAVVIAVSAKLGGSAASWLILVPALAGIGVAWQQAVNGRVKQTADSAASAAVINFGTGTAALAVAWVAELAVRGLPSSLPTAPWLYVGGFLGIFVIGGSAVLVHYTGVLVLSMGMVAGQLLGALVLDLVVPAPGTHVAASTLIGVLLTFVAVAVASLPDRSARA
ncbi:MULTISPECIES: DMT family transporter [unclassified Saccharopolyspora]|uniref:DMT family transporter n=1 Tax=Saccharopolyspora TaxID=1835 RepID=UPI0019097C5B|nr:DMT family transporter [Saccharopolyspora sp. HNM0986]MBK0865881.1 DMT family transporter [Saccharopolyspora sp. HNM0986]